MEVLCLLLLVLWADFPSCAAQTEDETANGNEEEDKKSCSSTDGYLNGKVHSTLLWPGALCGLPVGQALEVALSNDSRGAVTVDLQHCSPDGHRLIPAHIFLQDVLLDVSAIQLPGGEDMGREDKLVGVILVTHHPRVHYVEGREDATVAVVADVVGDGLLNVLYLLFVPTLLQLGRNSVYKQATLLCINMWVVLFQGPKH